MEPPENCPQRLYDLMQLCWQKKPQRRPTFMELVTRLLPDIGPNFSSVSFYHQPDNKDLRDVAVAAVIAKSKANAPLIPPLRGDIEDFNLGPDSESDEDLGEAAALTSSRAMSPVLAYPSIGRSPIETRVDPPPANNNTGPKVVTNGGSTTPQANGFLSTYNNHRHNNHHGLNHSASSSSEPHKTTEC
jgi:hypothetical protein